MSKVLQPMPGPTLAEALPVFLDALAAAPAKNELRTLMRALVERNSPHYRAGLAELLGLD